VQEKKIIIDDVHFQFLTFLLYGTVVPIMKALSILGYGALYIFATIGLVVTIVFFGMQYGLLNVRGSISERNASFGTVPKIATEKKTHVTVPFLTTFLDSITGTTASSTEASIVSNGCINSASSCVWNETTHWIVVHDALIKDAPLIDRVAAETGVSNRMIASAVIPEQIRFFTSNREVYKRYFEPLKLLVSLSKFSLGVSGIKQDTAVSIETYATDMNSEFYPGAGMADLIAYPTGTTHDTELFNRLTDEKNHYYSYLYTALFLKEIQAQWQKAGLDVQTRPDVLVTLFNLGFNASHPNPEPKVAGSAIALGGQEYSFGYLGTLFYHSDELIDIFPR
jgi:hypothetical protein